MGFLSRKPKGLLPPNIISMMERFGRHELDLSRPRVDDPDVVWTTTQQPLLNSAMAEPERFVRELAHACVPVGGFAVHGAHRTILNLFTDDLHSEEWFRILDASLVFLRQNYVAPARIDGYAWTRFLETGGSAQSWIPMTAPPSRESASITPLAPGEYRRLVLLGHNADDNVFIATERDGQFVAINEARRSDEDPTRCPSDWERFDTLYDLYVGVAYASQIRGWSDPELRPFFPTPDALI